MSGVYILWKLRGRKDDFRWMYRCNLEAGLELGTKAESLAHALAELALILRCML